MRIYLQLKANRIELAAFPETKCKELKVRYLFANCDNRCTIFAIEKCLYDVHRPTAHSFKCFQNSMLGYMWLESAVGKNEKLETFKLESSKGNWKK